MIYIAIIGGGAAGLAAAVRAAELARAAHQPLSISVFEATDKVGRPILRSGNGRCNFSHQPIDPGLYHGAEFVAATLEALAKRESETVRPEGQAGDDPDPVLRFFASLGLVWRAESDGRLYPFSNRASVVLDCLLRAIHATDVDVSVATPLRKLEPPRKAGGPYTLELADGALLRAQSVIIACGQDVCSRLVPDGVAVAPPVPLLGPLRLASNPLKAADGQRLRAAVGLRRQGTMLAAEFGEVLIRPYGVSGIAVMNLSRLAAAGDELVLNGVAELVDNPGGSERPFGPLASWPEDDNALAETEAWLSRRRSRLSDHALGPLRIKDLLTGLFSRAMSEAYCRLASVDEQGAPDDTALRQLAAVLCRATFSVAGIGPKDACQIHRGGVERTALDPATLAVHGHPGLYVVGEAVDVDGPCGGYNLHWAWASALAAAEAAVEFVGGA